MFSCSFAIIQDARISLYVLLDDEIHRNKIEAQLLYKLKVKMCLDSWTYLLVSQIR